MNGALNELMVAQALNWLELTKHDRVLDLFCGMGNFTLPVAERAGEVVGVEGGMRWSARHGRMPVSIIWRMPHFITRICRGILPEPWAASGFNKVLLDPARAGMAEIMPHIVALSPSASFMFPVIPQHLQRDSQVLHGAGITGMLSVCWICFRKPAIWSRWCFSQRHHRSVSRRMYGRGKKCAFNTGGGGSLTRHTGLTASGCITR